MELLQIDDLGVPHPAAVSPCLSLGARCFHLGPDCEVTKNLVKRLSLELSRAIFGESPPDPQFRYFGVLFELSLHEYRVGTKFIAPDRAEIEITLTPGHYVAIEGEPQNESVIQTTKIKYVYGTKIESASKLTFKLGWENKEVGAKAAAGGEVGEKLTNDYQTILETEATTEFCSLQYINPLSNKPGWLISRRPHQRILKDTKSVWLIIQSNDTHDPLPSVTATMSANFRKVRETESKTESPLGIQHRVLEDVAFSRARTWCARREFKEPVSISIDFSDLMDG